MIKINKPKGYWTKEKCIEDAKKYKTRSEWKKKSSSGYTIAKNNNWLNVCCKHMVSGNKLRWKKL